MAIIRPIHGEMSGSVAGNTWSRNRGGQYVRQRTTPVNPTSSRQLAVRSALSFVSRQYGTLTAAQRAQWDVWASTYPVLNRLGQAISLSGHQAYNLLSSRLRDIGALIPSTPPATPAAAAIQAVDCTANAATTATFAFSPTTLASGQRLAVYWTGPHSASVNPNRNQATLVGYSAAAPVSPITMNLPATVTPGQRTNFYVHALDAQGRLSPALKVIRIFS